MTIFTSDGTKPRRQFGRVWAGLLFALLAHPVSVLAQSDDSSTGPSPLAPLTPTTEPVPGAETAPPETTPQQPASPFGPLPETFPGLAAPAATTTPQPTTPFGAAPETFPGLSSPPTPPPPTSPLSPGATVPPPEPAPAPLLMPGYNFGAGPQAPVVGAPPVLALPAAPPNAAGFQPLVPGAIPVQAQDIRAPSILYLPTATLFQGYTDNPRYARNTLSDSVTRLSLGSTISIDTVRLQGQLSSSLDYYKYARATDETALNQTLLAYGLGTIIPEHVYVDARGALTQFAGGGGTGFANPASIPPSQQTQALVTSFSPIVRGSLDGLVEGEFRYNFGLTMFKNGSSLFAGSPGAVPSTTPTALSDTIQNEATLSLATGQRIDWVTSKLTLDAVQVATQSPARSTQLHAYDDLDRQINNTFAVLGRVGYDQIRYPLQPTASTKGPVWLIGARVTGSPGNYVIVQYGLQDGIYGSSGLLRYQLTPSITLLASLSNKLTSSQEGALETLDASQQDVNGQIVDQYSGLPSALFNPEFSYLTNGIFRDRLFSVGLQATYDRDTFGLFLTSDHRVGVGALSPSFIASPMSTGNDTANGANLNWSRSLTPKLSSTATLGYSTDAASHGNTITGEFSLTYTLSESFTCILHYQLIDANNAATVGVSNGSFRRNLLEVGVKWSL